MAAANRYHATGADLSNAWASAGPNADPASIQSRISAVESAYFNNSGRSP